MLHDGQVVAQHVRCYQRRQLIVLPDHRLAALALRADWGTAVENAFDALGAEARQFHLRLKSQPVKTGVHLRRLIGLARLYGTARCWPPSLEPLNWQLTTPRMSKTSCWQNAGSANFPRPRCPLPGGAS